MFCSYGCGPAVVESSRPLQVEDLPDNRQITQSGVWPKDARGIQFAIASQALQGRFLAYTVEAPMDQLREHVRREFAAHPAGMIAVERELENSTMTRETVERYERWCGINLDWFKPYLIQEGVVFLTDEPEGFYPTIWLDYDESRLYLLMID